VGHPKYTVTRGDIVLDGESLLNLYPEERVLRGVMLAFQNPTPVPEVRLSTIIVAMLNKRLGKYITEIPNPKVVMEMNKLASELGLTPDHLSRGIHFGFSGGEMKRAEMLQLLMAKPKVALLDEPDSGLDVDGIAVMGRYIAKLAEGGSAVMVTTHHAKVLHYVKPTKVIVMANGRIVYEGDEGVVRSIESMGYERFLKEKLGTQ
jgi:Fe-S cluster assembly ATP-binding protein